MEHWVLWRNNLHIQSNSDETSALEIRISFNMKQQTVSWQVIALLFNLFALIRYETEEEKLTLWDEAVGGLLRKPDRSNRRRM